MEKIGVEVRAVFLRKQMFNVKFDLMGHGNTIPDETVLVGEKLLKPDNPTAIGYIFEGWYADEKYSQLFDFNNVVEKDITLYAKWTKHFNIIDSGGWYW